MMLAVRDLRCVNRHPGEDSRQAFKEFPSTGQFS